MSRVQQVALLRCPNCTSELEGLSEDVLFFCTECGRAWTLEEELVRTPITILGTPAAGTLLLPFWLARAAVGISQRITRRRSISAAVSASRHFTAHEERGLQETGGRQGTESFIIPAFACTRALSVAVALKRNPPPLRRAQLDSYPPVVGGSVGPADAIALAHAVAVGAEVEEKDFLASVAVELQPKDVSVLAIVCPAGKLGFQIDDTGVPVTYESMEDAADILAHNGMEGFLT